MVGKKNIVFGFLYLVLTAALGPLMVNMYADFGSAMVEKQQSVGRLQALQENEFEEDLEVLKAEQIAKANTAGILSINKLMNAEMPIDGIKGGPHAHGNLEALLNIVVGLVIGMLAVAVWLKQLVSWLFIVGTVMHSGMLYLANVFGFAWAETLLQTGIGPVCVLAGLLAAGVAAAIGLTEEKNPDA
ncbi:MAG: hypothetical protein OEY36_12990 [Gammaproteobacteria bacterium]|nr:hypothetical protein [Gammaproteobacteria bacterium]